MDCYSILLYNHTNCCSFSGDLTVLNVPEITLTWFGQPIGIHLLYMSDGKPQFLLDTTVIDLGTEHQTSMYPIWLPQCRSRPKVLPDNFTVLEPQQCILMCYLSDKLIGIQLRLGCCYIFIHLLGNGKRIQRI